MHFVGKTGTAVLMISIVGLMVADIERQMPVFEMLHYAAISCAIWGIGLYWMAGILYMRQGIGLLQADGRQKAVR